MGSTPDDDRFLRERWTLTIELDDLDEQYSRDGENVFPNDEATRIATFITGHWSVLPEEIPECVRWTDTRVEATTDILDSLMEVVPWVMMHSVPLRIEVSRV